MCGAENCIIRKVDQKYVESFDMCFWKRTEEVSCTDRVRNEVLSGVKVEQNIINKMR